MKFVYDSKSDRRDNTSKLTHLTLYMTGRSRRGWQISTLILLYFKLISFWIILVSLSFTRRLCPSMGSCSCWHGSSILRIMLTMKSRLVPIHSNITYRMIFISLSRCFGVVFPIPLSISCNCGRGSNEICEKVC